MGRRHRAFVGNLNQLLASRLHGRAIVWVQLPVVLAEDTEPPPDLMVLQPRRPVPYKEREADAEDVLLLIEVADSSLAYDRSTKLGLYAEAGIPSTGWSMATPRSWRCTTIPEPVATGPRIVWPAVPCSPSTPSHSRLGKCILVQICVPV